MPGPTENVDVNYALRNSLILGALLLTVLGAGYYWTARQTDRLEAIEAEHALLLDELRQVEAVMALYDTAAARLDLFEERRRDQSQWLAAEDSPARTLAYLNELSERRKRRLNFDLHYQAQSAKERHTEHLYSVEGLGPFADVFDLVRDLEEGPLFYTVDHLELGGLEASGVEFKLVLRSYFSDESQEGERRMTGPLARAPHNPFRPLIARSLPANDAGLLELDGARLSALTHEQAFISDRSGRIHTLRPGDPVFLGRLAAIDISRNRAVFVLNKGGIVQRHVLEVEMHTSRR